MSADGQKTRGIDFYKRCGYEATSIIMRKRVQ
jgi:hypothetical protein